MTKRILLYLSSTAILFTLLAGANLISPAVAQEVYAREVVGQYNIDIQPGYNLISIPFLPLPAERGTIGSLTSTGITDNSKSWTADEFKYVEGSQPTTYLLVITSGGAEGRYFTIIDNTQDTLTIDDKDGSIDLTLILSGNEDYLLQPLYRLTDIFGEVNNSPLQAGEGWDVADNILTWTGTGWDTPIFLGDFVGTEWDGWWQGSNRVDDLPIYPNEAFFVYRLSSSATQLVITGSIPRVRTVVEIFPGYNLVGQYFPLPVELQNSNLKESGFTTGAGWDVADNILPWTGSGWDTPIFLGDFVGTEWDGWWQGSNRVDTDTLDPGKGYFIYNITQAYSWIRPKPYTTP